MLVSRKKAEEARTVLAMPQPLEDINVALVTLAYRTAAVVAHPDKGGTADAFARVDWAKHALMGWLARQSTANPEYSQVNCRDCDGKGFIIHQYGFNQLRRQCRKCKGTGDADYVEETE